MRVLVLSAALLLCSGCVTTQSVPLADRQFTFDAGYGEVFDAFVAHLTAEGYGLAALNRDEGLISTEYRQKLSLGHPRKKVSVWLKREADKTRAVVSIIEETADEEGVWGPRVRGEASARTVYERLYAGVAQRLPLG